jgi:hypothetical protein
VRWYLTYGLSLRDLKDMVAERSISVDHSTSHRWVVHFCLCWLIVSIVASATSAVSLPSLN